MSHHMLLCAAMFAVTLFGVSIQGQISPAATDLEVCSIGSPVDAAVATITRLSVCVVGANTIIQAGALITVKKAVDEVMQQGATKFDTCSLFPLQDPSQNVINVQGYDSVILSIAFNTTAPIIPPVSTITTKIQRTDGPNQKVTFIYQNSYLYPTETINVYKLDTAVTFEICPIPGSYDLFINVWSLTDCIVAVKVKVQVGPKYPFISQ